MSEFDDSEHRKKRRRREIPPRPVHARLVFDDHVKADGAVLSKGLAATLGLSMYYASQPGIRANTSDQTALLTISTLWPLLPPLRSTSTCTIRYGPSPPSSRTQIVIQRAQNRLRSGCRPHLKRHKRSCVLLLLTTTTAMAAISPNPSTFESSSPRPLPSTRFMSRLRKASLRRWMRYKTGLVGGSSTCETGGPDSKSNCEMPSRAHPCPLEIVSQNSSELAYLTCTSSTLATFSLSLCLLTQSHTYELRRPLSLRASPSLKALSPPALRSSLCMQLARKRRL